MDQLFSALTNLSLDPFKQLAYEHNPEGALSADGAAARELEIIRRWRQGEFSDTIVHGGWNRCACAIDPGPDIETDPEPDPLPSLDD